jgi:hypothetical protein
MCMHVRERGERRERERALVVRVPRGWWRRGKQKQKAAGLAREARGPGSRGETVNGRVLHGQLEGKLPALLQPSLAAAPRQVATGPRRLFYAIQ